MPKKAMSVREAEKIAQQIAEEQNVELVDVELVKEPTGHFLRFYIEKPDGISLNELETFHRRIQPLVENVEYDFMEVSSPGADRPLKTERDFERALGQNVEIRFYRQMDGQKQLTGRLTDFDAESVTVDAGAGAMRIARADAALIRMTLDDEELASPLFDELERAAQEQETQTQDGGESVT